MIDTIKAVTAQLTLWLISIEPTLALLAVIILCITTIIIKRMELKAAAEALAFVSIHRTCKKMKSKNTNA